LRHSGEGDAARLEVQKEQHIVGCQPTPSEHLHSEEIGARQYRQVGADEIRPTHVLARLGSRSDTKPTQDVSDGLIGNVVTENLECADDAIVSPAAILTSEADDEVHYLRCNGQPTRIEGRREPSNLRATSLRNQARMVSGLATEATKSSPCRPRRLPRTARVVRSGSVKKKTGGQMSP